MFQNPTKCTDLSKHIAQTVVPALYKFGTHAIVARARFFYEKYLSKHFSSRQRKAHRSGDCFVLAPLHAHTTSNSNSNQITHSCLT